MADYTGRSYHIARQIKIEQCIELGVWDDRDHFKTWLFSEFGTNSTTKLTPAQLPVLWIYLRYFAGEIAKPNFDAPYPWRANSKQLWRLENLVKALGWNDEQTAHFIEKQLGVKTFPRALSKQAASKLITGLDKVYDHFKKRGEHASSN